MSPDDSAFYEHLYATYTQEAQEHLQAIADGLLQLEGLPPDAHRPILETILREVHSLKGAARAVEAATTESFCQSMESLFQLLIRKDITPAAAIYDLLYRVIDSIRGQLGKSADTPMDNAVELSMQLNHLLQGINHIKTPINFGGQELNHHETGPDTIPAEDKGSHKHGTDRPRPDQPNIEATCMKYLKRSNRRHSADDTIRVPIARLEALLRQVEELIVVKQSMHQRKLSIREMYDQWQNWQWEWGRTKPLLDSVKQWLQTDPSVLASDGKYRQLENILAFLQQGLSRGTEFEDDLQRLSQTTAQDQRRIERMVDGLNEEVKQVLMLPFAAILDALPIMVRNLARDQSKRIHLGIEGGDVEADKRILEHLKDPLIHLIRNAIDHGVEIPERRKALKKNPSALSKSRYPKPAATRPESSYLMTVQALTLNPSNKRPLPRA